MSDPLKPSVARISSYNEIDRFNKLIPHVLVTYFVGPHGPFSIDYLEKDFSAETVTAVMKAQADEINALPT